MCSESVAVFFQMDSSRWHSKEFEHPATFPLSQLREHFHAKERLIVEASDLRANSRLLEERAEVAEAFREFVLHDAVAAVRRKHWSFVVSSMK
jgi:hypothetical protein